jgi:hypothetical protein
MLDFLIIHEVDRKASISYNDRIQASKVHEKQTNKL